MLELAQQLLELNGNVKRLLSDVEKLSTKVEAQERRLTLLEGTGDVLRADARRVAAEQVLTSYASLSERVAVLQSTLNGVNTRVASQLMDAARTAHSAAE